MKLEEKLPALQDVCAHAARALPMPGSPIDPEALEDLDRALTSDVVWRAPTSINRHLKDFHFLGHGHRSSSRCSFQAIKELEEEFSAAVAIFSLTGPILSFTLAVISIAQGNLTFDMSWKKKMSQDVSICLKCVPPPAHKKSFATMCLKGAVDRAKVLQTSLPPSHSGFWKVCKSLASKMQRLESAKFGC